MHALVLLRSAGAQVHGSLCDLRRESRNTRSSSSGGDHTNRRELPKLLQIVVSYLTLWPIPWQVPKTPAFAQIAGAKVTSRVIVKYEEGISEAEGEEHVVCGGCPTIAILSFFGAYTERGWTFIVMKRLEDSSLESTWDSLDSKTKPA